MSVDLPAAAMAIVDPTPPSAADVTCRSCDGPLDPRETDTVALARETLAYCPTCYCWTGFDAGDA